MASGVLWSCLLGNEPSTVKALLDLILGCPAPVQLRRLAGPREV